MSPISDRQQQAGLSQLGEMRAGGLRRDPSREGKLAGGQRAAIEKRREYRGYRRLPDQRRYFGDETACNHLPYITPDPSPRLGKHFDDGRSLPFKLVNRTAGRIGRSGRTIPAGLPASSNSDLIPSASIARRMVAMFAAAADFGYAN